MLAHQRIITAIDENNPQKAIELARPLIPHCGLIKLGLEYFVANGKAGIDIFAENNANIFLDLKFHDIPNTVFGAVKSSLHPAVKMLTIHASGGLEMMQKALEAVSYAENPPLVLAVSILTSLDDQALQEIGFARTMQEQVLHLAELALKAGIKGMVCSPLEIAAIRARFGRDLILVTPGIRTENLGDDQKRVLTPRQAIDAGADYLVIGRPITGSANPQEKLAEIVREI
jgi:orotidine-5'-phosphate decarboxylase